jgi:hypothetical protein
METGGQGTSYRYSFSEGGWHVSHYRTQVFASLLTKDEGSDGFFVSWKPYVVVSQQ